MAPKAEDKGPDQTAKNLCEADHRGADGTAGATRRGFLGITALFSALASSLVGLPVLRLFAGPLDLAGRDDKWVPLGAADEFSEERREVLYTFEQQEGWYVAEKTRRVLVGKEGDEFIVLSTRCTHAGCGVTWMPDQQILFCPCHDGKFNADGSVKSGPPPKPLERLEVRVRDGQLEVKEA